MAYGSRQTRCTRCADIFCRVFFGTKQQQKRGTIPAICFSFPLMSAGVRYACIAKACITLGASSSSLPTPNTLHGYYLYSNTNCALVHLVFSIRRQYTRNMTCFKVSRGGGRQKAPAPLLCVSFARARALSLSRSPAPPPPPRPPPPNTPTQLQRYSATRLRTYVHMELLVPVTIDQFGPHLVVG